MTRFSGLGFLPPVFGVLLALFQVRAAQDAVAVRPRLAEVDYLTALFASHGGDWLFYHFPVASSVVTVVVFGFLGVFWGVLLGEP